MHLGKTKSLLIVILLLANAVLAGLLGWRIWSDERLKSSANSQLIGLLAERGINVTRLPDDQQRVPALLVPRSYESEEQAVRALLGDAESASPGGGITDYENSSGYAQLRAGGRFEIRYTGKAGADAVLDSGEDDLIRRGRQTLLDMGLSGVSGDARTVRENDGSWLVSFGQTVLDYPVFNARAELSYSSGGKLEHVGGWWCFGTPEPDGEALCKSAGAALLQYAASLDDGQTLNVRDIQLGYRLRPYPPEDARLTPEWRIICDDREIYLDAFTNAQSAE